MSVQFLQSTTPQENQTIRVNDCIVRGHSTVAEYLNVTGNATCGAILTIAPNSDPLASGKILLPAMTVYTQGTSQTTQVSIASGDQQFIVDTFAAASIPGGSSISFAVNNPSIVLNKTIVVMNKMGSTNALTEVNDFVSVTAAGGMTITRHNFGATAAVGLQRLCFKLIQTA
jgi:hypothetical protein